MTSSPRSRKGQTVDVSDAEIDAAYRRRERRLAEEPLAVSVRYDQRHDVIVITMSNDAQLSIPRGLMQGLSQATRRGLHGGIVTEQGTVLTWPELDVDFTVIGLLTGLYGGRSWMSELARHAGTTTSPAKAAAARRNGRKGGRPPKNSQQHGSARKR